MSALEELRQSTNIDIDSLDLSVATKYGPFVDCTSNQAILWFELQKPEHNDLLKMSARRAGELKERFDDVKIESLGVEIANISLALRLVPHLRGCIHIQANTLHARSMEGTVADAIRLKVLTQLLDPAFDISRLCIKIPSTWEGLQACHILESQHGVKTLATTVFGFPQALVAGEAGCHYIAPYMHRLPDIMSNTLRQDAGAAAEIDQAMSLVVTTQQYYQRFRLRTQVLPAGLMTEAECHVLKGVHHLTLAPQQIVELAGSRIANLQVDRPFETKASGAEEAQIQWDKMKESALLLNMDEGHWREAMEIMDGGIAQRRMDEAIGVFDDMQRKLEAMMVALL